MKIYHDISSLVEVYISNISIKIILQNRLLTLTPLKGKKGYSTGVKCFQK